MFSRTRILAVTALCAATLLTGCSGSDGSDGGDDNAEKTPTAGSSVSVRPDEDAPCQSKVTITGPVEVSWERGADVVTSGDSSTYSTADGESNVLVQSGTKKQPGVVTVALSGDILASKPGAKGIDADPEGSGAEVDTDVAGKVKKKQVTLHVTATFDCEKS
jgi:hypothetical protein